MRNRRPARWLLPVIAAPAAVAIWSGWVGLGGLCGFGPVNLFPGIAGGFTINTAITLPIGVEAYAAYALGVWMGQDPGAGGTGGRSQVPRAGTFAMWSALGALGYGMLGQVVYHLLAAAHVTAAPWPIVVMVSCMPVVVLGFAAALTHLLRAGEDVAGEVGAQGDSAGVSPATIHVGVPNDAEHAAELALRASTAAGNPLSQRQLMTRFGISRIDERAMRQRVTEDPPAGVTHPPSAAPAGASLNGHGAAHA